MINDLINRLVEGNERYQWKIMQQEERLAKSKNFPKYPVLILTCMDPIIDVYRIFQLEPGDVFILRNAGNLYTRDVLRSLLLAIHEFNIKIIIVLGHMDCSMRKVSLKSLRKNLLIPALSTISRNGTNVLLEIQKFFQTFIDEIKNIKIQVQKLRAAKEIPGDIQITGMMYDSMSGWVFDYNELMSYKFTESFMRDYRDLIQKKKINFVDYIESIEDEIIGIEKKSIYEDLDSGNQLEKISEDLSLKDFDVQISSETKENSEDLLKSHLDMSPPIEEITPISDLIHLPKINIPKIRIPKVRIYIPKIYKEKSGDQV